MDAQAVFDKACVGIIMQGRPSVRNNVPVYRSGDGAKCAIGHLIPDDAYIPAMDAGVNGCAIDFLAKEFEHRLPKYLTEKKNQDFLKKLQNCHDNFLYYPEEQQPFVEYFFKSAKALADHFNLSKTEITKAYNLVKSEEYKRA